MLYLFEILLIINGRVVLHMSATELQTKTLCAFKMLSCTFVKLNNAQHNGCLTLFLRKWCLQTVLIVLLEKDRSLLVQPISFCLLNSQSGLRKEKTY